MLSSTTTIEPLVAQVPRVPKGDAKLWKVETVGRAISSHPAALN